MPIFPPRLRPGDQVAVFASAATGRWGMEPVKLGMKFLSDLGLRPKLGASVTLDPGYSCRSRQARADDVMALVRDPEVRGLFGLIGGSTTAEILPLLDYGDLARDPKVIMGSSDIAALLLAAHAKTGLVTFLGENVMWGLSKARKPTRAYFERTLMRAEPGLLPDESQRVTWREGKAQGTLIAANLFTLRGLIGTPYLPKLDGAILAWEELHEDLEDLAHMLTHLRNAGLLQGLEGMVVGHLEGIVEEEHGHMQDELILHACEGTRFPILKMTEFGHYRPSAILPLGVKVSIDAGAQTFVFDQPAVR